MSRFSDEEVMAHVDGELDPARERDYVEAFPRDASLALRERGFRMTRDPLSKAYDVFLREPPPAHLVATILGAAQAPAISQRVRPFMYTRMVLQRLTEAHRFPVWTLPAASAAALAVAVATGWLLLPGDGPTTSAEGRVMAAPALRDALEKAPSGSETELAGDRSSRLKLSFSFRTKQGGWCRGYDMLYGADVQAAGLACRDQGGEWRITDQTSAAKRRTSPAAQDAISHRVMATIDGAVLTTAQEAQLIDSKWSSPKP